MTSWRNLPLWYEVNHICIWFFSIHSFSLSLCLPLFLFSLYLRLLLSLSLSSSHVFANCDNLTIGHREKFLIFSVDWFHEGPKILKQREKKDWQQKKRKCYVINLDDCLVPVCHLSPIFFVRFYKCWVFIYWTRLSDCTVHSCLVIFSVMCFLKKRWAYKFYIVHQIRNILILFAVISLIYKHWFCSGKCLQEIF